MDKIKVGDKVKIKKGSKILFINSNRLDIAFGICDFEHYVKARDRTVVNEFTYELSREKDEKPYVSVFADSLVKEKSRVDILIEFMYLKNEKLKYLTGIHNYFNKSDEEAIKDLGEIECEDIVESIKDSIESGAYTDSDICPFCIVYNCNDCPYGKEHGICSDEFSGFYQINYVINKAIKEISCYRSFKFFIENDKDKFLSILKGE